MTSPRAAASTADAPLRPGQAVVDLKGVGPARERALSSAGVGTVLDLLLTVPVRYEDRRERTALEDVRAEGHYTVVGRLSDVSTVRPRRRMTLVRARLGEGAGALRVTWFNQPYLASRIDADEEYLLHGKVRLRGDDLELLNPSLERIQEGGPAARVVPVYPAIGSVGPSIVRTLVATAISAGALENVTEPLPDSLLERHGLPALGAALRELHTPATDCDASALNALSTPAHLRLIYGELLRHQAALALTRHRWRSLRKRHAYRDLSAVRRSIGDALPFRLTAAQERSVDEIFEDLERPEPMLRLLQGDVGSGKTVVAGMALAAAAASGLQAVLMAPTELLAEQHHRSLRSLLGHDAAVRLLTATTGGKEVRSELERGRAGITVGTHALLQHRVGFRNLGLVVVDEQHRFGVGQRRALTRKGARPDLLVMTATPIPRSLAMTVYGDLALSAIDELPPGRHPVETVLETEGERRRVYRAVEKELELGHKAFVVLPLIEESERVAATAVEGLGRRIERRLARYRPSVLHGRMSAEEKSEAMAGFASGDCQVLIATTLVEVGVDVGAATIMVIESAERFGLAQLHQLRGRVGRGGARSKCIAVYGRLTDVARRRLEVFEKTADGFLLAEADLEFRGPGDLLGTRQAGVPSLRVADLARHRDWIRKAREDARRIVRERPPEARGFLHEVEASAGREDRLAGG